MPLSAGKRLGSYEILSIAGVGGMGEVYKARDTRLERIVAIKVLPEHIAESPDLRQRFEREAKAISNLSHPHICTLHDVGSDAGVEFLVMEYLEGETAAERLAKGPLPFQHVLRYGAEIAEALDRAHRQGVTHRDLKPGNVMLTKAGAKLLDFGLAKLEPVAAERTSGSEPTASPSLTGSSAILGTLQYMAPEQLEGKAVDHRTDIFAFGAVVYEMATGKRVFDGQSQASLIGAILRDEPPSISTLQPLSPPAFDALVATCLAKDPEDRWQSAGDIARQLRTMQGSSPGAMAATVTPASRRAGWRRSLPFALTALAAGGAAGIAVWSTMRFSPPEPPRVARLLVTPPLSAPLANLPGVDVTISPDGSRIAYLAKADRSGNTAQLYVRDLDSLEARPIPGTEIDASARGNLFFSADGRSIGLSASGQTLRVSLAGGRPLKILDSETLGPAAWAADDTLIFSDGSALYRVAAGGGETPERLTTASEAGTTPYGPVLLPGERAVLFTSFDGESLNVAVLDLTTHEQRILAEDAALALYASSGHVVFVRDSTTLMAASFDLGGLVLTGEPVPVLEGIRRFGGTAGPDYALSLNGTLIYVPDDGQSRPRGTLVWVDRAGRAVERAVNEIIEAPYDPRLSPDGRRLALATGERADLWIYDLGGRAPILAAEGNSGLGVWSPDGTQIAFVSNRSETWNVYTLPADGSVRDPQAVNPSGLDAAPSAWSTDGELILARPLRNAADIVAARVEARGELREVVATSDVEAYPALSPDGRWLAYTSNRTGRSEVWVMAYPNGVPGRVSRNGGTEPVWSRDGRELFYRQGTSMMAVAMDTSGGELSFEAPVELFTQPYFTSPNPSARSYDVAADGRFLMIQLDGSADGPESIVVVQNWIEELKRQVPVSR